MTAQPCGGSSTNPKAAHVLPDAALTEILIRLIPKPGEPRVLTIRNGKPDLYMTPEAAAVWLEMRDRINALWDEHGEDRMMQIYEASVEMASKYEGAVQ